MGKRQKHNTTSQTRAKWSALSQQVKSVYLSKVHVNTLTQNVLRHARAMVIGISSDLKIQTFVRILAFTD